MIFNTLTNFGLLRQWKGTYILNAKSQKIYGGTHPRNWVPEKKEKPLTLDEAKLIIGEWSQNPNSNYQSATPSPDEVTLSSNSKTKLNS